MTGEQLLAIVIAFILVTGNMLLDRQMHIDRKNGIKTDPSDYRYGHIMMSWIGRVLKKFHDALP